jgi:hypothetical protein
MTSEPLVWVLWVAAVFVPAAVVAHRAASAPSDEHDPATCSDCLLLGLPAEPMRTLNWKDPQS